MSTLRRKRKVYCDYCHMVICSTFGKPISYKSFLKFYHLYNK